VVPGGTGTTDSVRTAVGSTPSMRSPITPPSTVTVPSGASSMGRGWPAFAQRSLRPPVPSHSNRAIAAVARVSECIWAIASSRPRSTSAGPALL
jgi:hypothetical protein